jgi:hypothetical protein
MVQLAISAMVEEIVTQVALLLNMMVVVREGVRQANDMKQDALRYSKKIISKLKSNRILIQKKIKKLFTFTLPTIS